MAGGIHYNGLHRESVDGVWTGNAQGCPQLQPQRWLSFNHAHQIVQAALSGQGLALARLPLVADALARGDLVEVLPGHRLDSPLADGLLVGPRSQQRPEVQAFCTWLRAEATATRTALGEAAEPRAPSP